MKIRSILIRSARYGIPGIFLISLVLFGIGAVVEANIEAEDSARYKPPGGLYDIGGRRLHLYCLGQAVQGQAPVILVSGRGDNTYTWWNLQQQLASGGMVCSYDRSGYGWSEAGPRPRTTSAMAEELRILLNAAGLQPPYLLVGHSLGGLVVRQYALDYSDEVQSLVLVDSLDADSLSRLPRLLMRPLLSVPAYVDGMKAVLQTAGILRLLNRWNVYMVSPVLTSLPAVVLPSARALYLKPTNLATAALEQAALADSVLAMTPRKLPADLPVISLLAAQPDGQPQAPEIMQHFEGLSSNSQVRQLTTSNHYLHLTAPGEVLDAIWELQR